MLALYVSNIGSESGTTEMAFALASQENTIVSASLANCFFPNPRVQAQPSAP
jgi:hypothetical protein